MQDIILSSKDIYKSFQNLKRQRLDILKGISMEIVKEKITVIVGASGAGKSTLLHILSGLDRPDSGEVIQNGKNIFKLSDDKLASFRNKHIGFVFQFHHLLPEFTAAENTAIPLMINNEGHDQAIEKSITLLNSVGLEDRINHKPSELSGGEQQRVAVARALINNPDIIFADEPTGNLDSANSELLHQLFVKLRDEFNKTFVIVTHNPDLMKVADVVFEMKDGQILS